ncbi:MAG: NAD(P)/FAD-dependent oxidoreductase [Chlorobi bacterium]|nr:NAD(P)/FAD-dependent oxidoreductase [Chlorobiota bacterium]
MKNLVILGAGTAGTLMANYLNRKLPDDWKITVVDQDERHYYQPGFLFLPFGIYRPEQLVKDRKRFLPKRAEYVQSPIRLIDADNNKVELEDRTLPYDVLVIATGNRIAPEETEGMKGELWHKEVFDFYTFEGANALREKLKNWKGGTLVVHQTEMPIKCPVAPLEFAFLADWYFTKKGMRDKVEILFVTPLDGAFTKPKASQKLSYLLDKKGIKEVTNFDIEAVDNDKKLIRDYTGREVGFDLLVTVPTNLGQDVIEHSGLGDDMNYVPTDKETLQSLAYDNIFVIGDATNVPASKAGSVAHFEGEILIDNILAYINGKPFPEKFDGHANCFIETGFGKALLIDFNYYTEPLEGKFPLPVIGPLSLLKETRINHWGKMAFRWIYWHMILKAIPIPFVPARMSMRGKKID